MSEPHPPAGPRPHGDAGAIYPSLTRLAAAAAMEHALSHLKATGVSQTPEVPLFDERWAR